MNATGFPTVQIPSSPCTISNECLEQFKAYMNKQRKNQNYTSELEVDNALPFLDVYVSRVMNKFVTSVYRKTTFSGIYTHYDSYIPLT